MRIIYQRNGYPFEGFDDLEDYAIAALNGSVFEYCQGIIPFTCMRVLSNNEEISFELPSNNLYMDKEAITEIATYIKAMNIVPIAFTITYIVTDAESNKVLYIIAAEKGNKDARILKRTLKVQEPFYLSYESFENLNSSLNPILTMLGIDVKPIVQEETCYNKANKSISYADNIKKGLCGYCGGTFKGFFKKMCSKCNKPKDY